MKNIGILLQARVGSSRLPNKMILPFCEEKPLLMVIIQRLKKFIKIPIIVATSESQKDNSIQEICEIENVPCFRGCESDVLLRFIDAAEYFNINKVIRICADNPFLDMELLQELINHFTANVSDYTSFFLKNGTPTIKTHYGLFTEAVSLSALKRVHSYTNNPLYKEHVTNYIYENPDKFIINKLPIPNILTDYVNLRLTLDTKTDFILLQDMYKEISKANPCFTIKDILKYIDKHHEIQEIMKSQILENSK